MKKMTKNSAVQAAARAHTNLNTFASVISILEGGHLYGGSTNDAAQRIIAICRREETRWLYNYDRAVEEAVKP